MNMSAVNKENLIGDRASHRAAAEAGYASLPGYVGRYSPPDAVMIPPTDAGVHVQVDHGGVWLGFFTEDGRSTVIDIESLPQSAALTAWADEQRAKAAKQAYRT